MMAWRVNYVEEVAQGGEVLLGGAKEKFIGGEDGGLARRAGQSEKRDTFFPGATSREPVRGTSSTATGVSLPWRAVRRFSFLSYGPHFAVHAGPPL
jgi:hypothetical protein